mmetsp:Transcript_27291/g.62624  ORF Transcript_27291/g.62624 Transcript_27291/m.62624 type:complete len:120 (-) Transcript_27291:142-501(-)
MMLQGSDCFGTGEDACSRSSRPHRLHCAIRSTSWLDTQGNTSSIGWMYGMTATEGCVLAAAIGACVPWNGATKVPSPRPESPGVTLGISVGRGASWWPAAGAHRPVDSGARGGIGPDET